MTLPSDWGMAPIMRQTRPESESPFQRWRVFFISRIPGGAPGSDTESRAFGGKHIGHKGRGEFLGFELRF